jgi:HPt (histidine-containing phosphotransfer) domain-containing protein
MKSHGQGRTQQLITGVLGLVLAAFICAALLIGLRAASGLTPQDNSLQDASALPAHANAPQQQKLSHAGAAAAQSEAATNATRLRLFVLSAVLATVALAGLAAHAQFARARHERAAREAREETRRLLQTVDEGFFLLDATLRIGAPWSAALTRMFNRQDFAGIALQELLQELLPPATLATAIEDIKLLWNGPAQENPPQSIDPLGDLEIRVDDGHGGRDTRHLQFNFHRFVDEHGVRQVLVRVGDVTSQVLLARELLEAQNSADSQVHMLLGVMQIDPMQLAAFIDATEAGLQLVNAVLKEPARTDGEFRMKLDRLARELHAIKADASALGITGVAQRTHRFEDLLTDLKERSELSGINFLPLVLKLDELLAHLRSIRELAVRVSALRDGALAAAPGSHALHAHERAVFPADDLAETLQGLAARLGRDQEKKFRLSLNGMAEIPANYRTTVRDLLIQLLRNSAVHGIESPEVRRQRSKAEEGLVHAEFRTTAEGYELVFEDDGAGLALEKLKTAAIRKHLTTAAEAARMDTRAAMGLIFRGGVSTCDRVTMDAGRGVGMELVARRIAALGGKIVLSTDPGKFTRVKIALPALQAAKSAVA